MKILLFLSSFFPEIGGMEKAADSLALELRSMGHEPFILAQRPKRDLGAVERQYPIVRFGRVRSGTLLPYSAELALERLHRKYGFDLVNAYQAYWTGYVAVRFGRRHNIPIVVSSRGGDIEEEARYIKRAISRKRIAWTLRHATAVTTLSEQHSQRVSVLTDGEVEARLIHNGVELMDGRSALDETPDCFAGLEGGAFILTLGRLRYFKGLDLLLDAIKLLKEQGEAVPKLVIAGDGREKDKLLEQVDANGLGDCVTFVGWVSGDERAWLLDNCMFLAQPSRAEGMPNSVLEALSYGKPVLASTIGGLPEIVTDGVSGLLVEPDNVGLLSESLRKMLAADLEEYSQNAREVAAAHSWSKIVEQHLRLYESLIDQSARGTY